ncbi:MAG: enoyl-CoA hydratase, partial [Rhodospirillales bacterium]|nr:enoyl-CoA hydratase [Rhodospirillales bacterium]
MECFSLEVVDHVATITTTRPPVNAQNRQFRHECVALFDEMHDRDDVRA